jgi:hydroxymethylglutaryl-CoA lyase
VVEVSPRDGLQNEPKIIPTGLKVNLIDQLSQTGQRKRASSCCWRVCVPGCERRQFDLSDVLSACMLGLKTIETTSFVSNKKIPQMFDCVEVMGQIKRVPGVEYSVLCPNMNGECMF